MAGLRCERRDNLCAGTSQEAVYITYARSDWIFLLGVCCCCCNKHNILHGGGGGAGEGRGVGGG